MKPTTIYKVKLWLEIVAVVAGIVMMVLQAAQAIQFMRHFRQLVTGGESKPYEWRPRRCVMGRWHIPHFGAIGTKRCLCEQDFTPDKRIDDIELDNTIEWWRMHNANTDQ